jgi:chromosome segregation ATPase
MEIDYSFQVDNLEKELDDKIELISKSSDTISKQSKTIQLLEKSFEEKQKFYKIIETDLKNDLNLHVRSLDKSKKTIALLNSQIFKSQKELADSKALRSKQVKELEDRIVSISKKQVESEEQYKKSLNLSKSVLNEVHKTTKKQMDLANGHNSVFKFLDLLRTKGF